MLNVRKHITNELTKASLTERRIGCAGIVQLGATERVMALHGFSWVALIRHHLTRAPTSSRPLDWVV